MEEKIMTIHEGLSKIKLYNAKLEKEVLNGDITPIMLYRDKDIGNDKEVATRLENFQHSEDGKVARLLALLHNKREIKKAIVLSNAKTKVKLKDKEYTIAEIIDMKNDLKLIKCIYDTLKSREEHSRRDLVRYNEEVQESCYSLFEQHLGNPETVKNTVINEFEKMNTWKMAKMFKYDELMEQLENEIDMLESEIDFKLSTSNAVTTITVNLA